MSNETTEHPELKTEPTRRPRPRYELGVMAVCPQCGVHYEEYGDWVGDRDLSREDAEAMLNSCDWDDDSGKLAKDTVGTVRTADGCVDPDELVVGCCRCGYPDGGMFKLYPLRVTVMLAGDYLRLLLLMDHEKDLQGLELNYVKVRRVPQPPEREERTLVTLWVPPDPEGTRPVDAYDPFADEDLFAQE